MHGGVKVVCPPTLGELLAVAARKAHLIWPDRPHATVAGFVDEDECEVDDENFVLVQPGSLLYVTAAGDEG